LGDRHTLAAFPPGCHYAFTASLLSFAGRFGHKESMANDPELDSIRRTPWFHAIAQAMTPQAG